MKCIETIEAFKNRRLSQEYAVVYTDVTCMSVRRVTAAKKVVHLAIGITVGVTRNLRI